MPCEASELSSQIDIAARLQKRGRLACVRWNLSGPNGKVNRMKNGKRLTTFPLPGEAAILIDRGWPISLWLSGTLRIPLGIVSI